MKQANTYLFSKTGFFSNYTLEADFENPIIEPNGAGVKIDGWTHYSPSTTLSVEPHNGSDWLKVVSTNGTHCAHQGFSVEPGETYTFEIDLHRPAGMNKEINVVIWKNTGPSGAYTLHVLNTDGFNTFNYTATSSNIYIQIRQAGTYYLDNIRMYRTYEDTIFVRGYEVDMAYRYGWNGQMRTDEISGAGNHYTALYLEYDSRLGRRWNLDPKYTGSESRYAVNGNNPIIYIDPLGDFKTKFGAWLYKARHGGEIRKDAGSGQYFVGKQVEYTGEGAGAAYQRRFDWNGGNQPYSGSGWGHITRSLFANIFGVDGKASSLTDMGMNSMLQNSSVQLTGDLLDRVKKDPAVQRLENSIVTDVQNNPQFGKEEFTTTYSRSVQLGGERGSLNPLSPDSKKTWQVAGNPLTWAVRSVQIEAQVKVSTEGCMNITYQFTDNFDLRPEKGGKVYFGDGNRPWQYNATTSILGLFYHDIAGGNDQMKVKATWTSER